MELEGAIRARKRLLWLALGLVTASELLAACGACDGAHRSIRSFVRGESPFFASALLASAVVFIGLGAPRRSRVVVIAAGVAAEVAHAILASDNFVFNCGGWFGVAALVMAGVDHALARERGTLHRLLATAVFPTFALASFLPLELSILLHPRTHDGAALVLDGTLFGVQPAFLLGRAFDASAAFRLACGVVYLELPVAAAFVYLLERRAGRRGDLQVSFLLAGLLGVALYHLAPTAGPKVFAAYFPRQVPSAEDAFAFGVMTAYRNAIPSLHTTWSLLIYWHARRIGRAGRAFGLAWLVVTVLAMLGFGEHYLTDVIVSIPFAVMARALIVRGPRVTIVVPALAFGAWILVLHAPSAWESALAMRALALVTTAAALWLESRIEDGGPSALPTVAAEAPSALGVLAAVSGFARVMTELVVVQTLSLWHMAMYFASFALGAFVASRLRVAPPRGMALASLAFAAASFSLLLPPWVVVVPGLLAGALFFFALRDGRSFGASVAGSAAGVIVASFGLLPELGLTFTLLVATLVHLGVALVALRLPGATPVRTDDESLLSPALVAFIAVGVACLGLHLSRVVAGDTVYARASAGAAVLLGLGAGLRTSGRRGPALPLAALAVVVVLGLFAWPHVPAYFGGFGSFVIARRFATTELVRALVLAALLVPPSFLAGAALRPPPRGLGLIVAAGVLGAGAVVLLLPVIGSQHTLQGFALVAAVAALARREHRPISGAALAAVVLLSVANPRLDWARLSTGASLHFAARPGAGVLVDHAESLEDGVAVVVQREEKQLVVNGRLRGEDAAVEKGIADALLHVTARDRAFVGGLGTGRALRALREFGRVTVGESDRVSAAVARRVFGDLPPNSTLAGAGFLETYDLIVLARETPRVELYEQARSRLTERGVLAQRLPLRYVAGSDLAAMLRTLHAVFPKIDLYVEEGDAIAVACTNDCPPSAATLTHLFGPAQIDRLVASGGGAVANDDNRYLDYHIPRSALNAPDSLDAELRRIATPER
ncbi:MAG: phosphatase PAP2 family protein [Labilithrix sp.]